MIVCGVFVCGVFDGVDVWLCLVVVGVLLIWCLLVIVSLIGVDLVVEHVIV